MERWRFKQQNQITNKQIERLKTETISLLNMERLEDYKEVINKIITRNQERIKNSKNEKDKELFYSNILWVRVFINCVRNLLETTKHLSDYEDFYIDMFIRYLIEMMDSDSAWSFEINAANKEINNLIFLLRVYPQILNTFSWIEEVRCDWEQEHVNNLLEMPIPYCWVLSWHRIEEEWKNVLLVKFIPTDNWYKVTKRLRGTKELSEWIWYWHVDVWSKGKPIPSYTALSPETNFDFERIPHIIISKWWIRLFLSWYLALISEKWRLFQKRFWKEEMKKEMLESWFYDKDSAERLSNMLTNYYYVVDIPFWK